LSGQEKKGKRRQRLKPQVLYVNEISKGIACRIGNQIYINKGLKKYPKLQKAIIKHEINHTSGFTMHDVKMDLVNNELKGHKVDYYKFVLTHPSSWTEFFPFDCYEGRFVYSIANTFIWFLAFITAGGILWTLR